MRYRPCTMERAQGHAASTPIDSMAPNCAVVSRKVVSGVFHWVAAAIGPYLVAQCGSVSTLGRGQRLLDWTLLHGTLYAANADSLCNPCRCEPASEAQQMDLKADLIRALQNDEFELEYQPILDIEGGRIVGFEALLRWQHPARGQISPAQFIPFAEESGLIVPIGSWALEQACAAASRWPEELRVAVNVSARQIERSLLQTIAGSLSRSSLSPQRLEIEITESRSLCTNTSFALIDDLKALGVSIVLDDFGTGYSSLKYLKKFSASKIKIDKCFVSDIDHCPVSQAIFSSVIKLARSLKMRVTAEGVETAKQFEWIRSTGCNEIQGFLFGRPLREADLILFLDRVKDMSVDEFLADNGKNWN